MTSPKSKWTAGIIGGVVVIVAATYLVRWLDSSSKVATEVAAINNKMFTVEEAAKGLKEATKKFEDVATRVALLEQRFEQADKTMDRLGDSDRNQNTRIEVVNTGILDRLGGLEKAMVRVETMLKVQNQQARANANSCPTDPISMARWMP